jgi:hypothetical protein
MPGVVLFCFLDDQCQLIADATIWENYLLDRRLGWSGGAGRHKRIDYNSTIKERNYFVRAKV